jgi:hypothetical protein
MVAQFGCGVGLGGLARRRIGLSSWQVLPLPATIDSRRKLDVALGVEAQGVCTFRGRC